MRHARATRILLHLYPVVCQNDNVKFSIHRIQFKNVLFKTVKGHNGCNNVQPMMNQGE